VAFYPSVERAHVVPRTFLRNFADADEMIGMRLAVDPAAERVISINDAAVRKRFYRRTRPDGTPIDDAERMLAMIEERAGPILRELQARWPLSFEEKHVLAEFFALQILRGERWRRDYVERTDRLVDDYRKRGLFADEIAASGLTVEEVADHNRDLFLSDTQRLRRMFGMSPKGSAILGSMIWSLIRFDGPMLATSDHPVTAWSRFQTSSRPKPSPFSAGLINFMEIRVSVSPSAAIVMTWLERAEDTAEPFEGRRPEARNLNAFTIAQAEKQWFHLPGTKPSFGKKRTYRPLSLDLFPGYGPNAADRSTLRNVVLEKVNSTLGEESTEYEIVRLTDGAGRAEKSREDLEEVVD
jgi:Protein of unknown function (DUF4238)